MTASAHSSTPIDEHPLDKINHKAISFASFCFKDGGSDGCRYIHVTPAILPSSGQWISLDIGKDIPAEDDWVGVYSPVDVNPTVTVPIKYSFASRAVHNITSGSYVMSFYLLNMREDIIFRYFSGGLKTPKIIANSNIVRFKNPNEPLQGRLTLTDKSDEMRITWTTRDTGYPQVLFGISLATSSKVYADSFTYTENDMCGSPAADKGWRSPGMFHTAVMKDLKPGQRYTYRFGDDVFGWSRDFSFVSPPLLGSPSKFFIYGDMGETEIDGASETNADFLPARNVTLSMIKEMKGAGFCLHIGDISYARGYSSEWDVFHAQIEPLATSMPYQVAIGNHERDFANTGSLFNSSDSGGECGVPHELRFPMATSTRDEPWYSFNWGLVHILVISTEHSFNNASKQWAFIENDLAAVNRTEYPWVIITGHRPAMIDSTFKEKPYGDVYVGDLLLDSLEEQWVKYGVDLAVWGHHHSYQRTCPVRGKKCVPLRYDGSAAAPVHIVIGTAGAENCRNILPVAPEWLESVSVDTHGFGRIAVSRHSLSFDYVLMNSTIFDSITLVK